MKKIKYLVLGIMLTTLVTGCGMKTNIMVDINNKKDVDFQVLIAMDDEMIDTMLSMGESSEDEESTEAKEYTDEDRWNYLNDGILEGFKDVKYEKYTEGKYKGYKVTAFTKNIDELTKDKADEKFNISESASSVDSLKDAVLFTKKGNNYVSNIKFDNSENESLSSIGSNSSSMDLFEVKFIVTLPNKAISNNADNVSKDGKTLTWDMTKDAKDVNFEFSFDKSSSNMMLYAIAGAVLVVGVVAVVVVVTNNKKKVA